MTTTIRKIKAYAKKNRHHRTPAESRLFSLLITWKIAFRTQAPIGFYIVDFLVAPGLVIELDGDSHNGREEYDRDRDAFLVRENYEVKRFPNDVVFEDPELIRTYAMDYNRRHPIEERKPKKPPTLRRTITRWVFK